MRPARLVPLFTTALLACATGSSPPAAPLPEENAPTPFTAAQIRGATSAGRTYDFLIEASGKPPVHHVIEFLDVNDQSASFQTTNRTGEGKDLAPARETRARWDELRQHALFPRAATTIHEERITVPAGTFDCLVYVVQGKDGEVNGFDFARNLPGPPVLFFTEQNGVRVMTSRLVRYEAGH